MCDFCKTKTLDQPDLCGLLLRRDGRLPAIVAAKVDHRVRLGAPDHTSAGDPTTGTYKSGRRSSFSYDLNSSYHFRPFWDPEGSFELSRRPEMRFERSSGIGASNRSGRPSTGCRKASRWA